MAKQVLVGGAQIAVAVLIIFGGLRLILGGLFTGLDANKIADIVTFLILALFSGGILVAFFAWLMWRIRQPSIPKSYPDHPEEVLDARRQSTLEELRGYQPPQAALPAPRRINVPIYRFNSQSQPIGAHPETVLTSSVADSATQQQVTLEVPLRYLYRFAKCTTPAREEWTGKPTIFYDCQRFFDAHGFLELKGKTKVWRESYPIKNRLDWLSQFEPGATLGEASPTPPTGEKQENSSVTR